MDEPRLRRIYDEASTIAVVGASTSEGKPSHDIPAYLREQGYRIVPVNPTADEVLGEPAYDSLDDVDEDVDVVDVFRPADEAPAIAEQAVRAGASVLWLQSGIVSDEAAGIAADAGVEVVMDRCMGVVHRQLGLGDGPA